MKKEYWVEEHDTHILSYGVQCTNEDAGTFETICYCTERKHAEDICETMNNARKPEEVPVFED